jgi:hypothetical protein
MEQQPSAGRNWWKIGGIGCLSIIALGFALTVLIVIIAVASGGGGSDTGPPVGDQASSGAQEQSISSGDGSGSADSGNSGGTQQPEADLGEELAVGDARWTVGSAVYTTQQRDQIMQENVDGSFVVVEYTFTNAGNEELTVDSEYINLVDGDGNSYSISDNNMDYVPMEQDLMYEGVNPGTSRQGIAVFEVPPEVGQQELALEVDAGETFSGETGYISLGVPAAG